MDDRMAGTKRGVQKDGGNCDPINTWKAVTRTFCKTSMERAIDTCPLQTVMVSHWHSEKFLTSMIVD